MRVVPRRLPQGRPLARLEPKDAIASRPPDITSLRIGTAYGLHELARPIFQACRAPDMIALDGATTASARCHSNGMCRHFRSKQWVAAMVPPAGIAASMAGAFFRPQQQTYAFH